MFLRFEVCRLEIRGEGLAALMIGWHPRGYASQCTEAVDDRQKLEDGASRQSCFKNETKRATQGASTLVNHLGINTRDGNTSHHLLDLTLEHS